MKNSTAFTKTNRWLKFTFDTEKQLASAIALLEERYRDDANKNKVRFKAPEMAVPPTLFVADISQMYNLHLMGEFEKLGGSFVKKTANPL